MNNSLVSVETTGFENRYEPSPAGAADELYVTDFQNLSGATLRELRYKWEDLCSLIHDPPVFPNKQACPLIKLARFGTRKTKKGSLRWNDNVVSISGIEADYDGESVTMGHAAGLLAVAGIQAILYTSPSHTPDKPRWRVLCPLSSPHLPQARSNFAHALNDVLQGILATESFILSQAYYFGHVQGTVYEAIEVKGRPIDVVSMERPAPQGSPRANRRRLFEDGAPPLQLVEEAPDEMTRRLHARDAVDYPETPENQRIVASMLNTYAPDNGVRGGGSRDKWFRSVLAVASLNWGKPGEAIARNWSASGALYEAAEFDSAFRCYDGRENGVSFATLISYAREAGYRGAGPKLADLPGSDVRPSADRTAFSSAATALLEDQGDVLNGRLFAELYRDQLKYVFSKGDWLRFDGMRWVWCEVGEQMQAAKDAARSILKRATDAFALEPTSSATKQAVSHATKTFDERRLLAMLRLAAAEPGMGISGIEELDANPMLLGVQNGVVNLRGGRLMQAAPNQLITRQCNAQYDSNAECPRWLQFLNDCFGSDAATIRYLQKAIGYSLTGSVQEEVMHFCYGAGLNGKSVMANTLYRLLGGYAQTMRTDSLMRSSHDDGPTNDIARLAGARLVLANETRVEHVFDDARLKELVSTETIAARFLHREFFEFKPTHKIWVRGNHKPRVADSSIGAWRRIRLLPFERTLAPGTVDQHLESKLEEEFAGILRWAIDGCQLWQAEGLHACPAVHNANVEYRSDCDILAQWVDETCDTGPGFNCLQNLMWLNYRGWMENNGHSHGTKNAFTRKLKERNVMCTKPGGKPHYSGIRLKP